MVILYYLHSGASLSLLHGAIKIWSFELREQSNSRPKWPTYEGQRVARTYSSHRPGLNMRDNALLVRTYVIGAA